jgi:hypothetical protein
MHSRVNRIATLTAAALSFASTHAANIYALSSGSPTIDAAVVSTLTSRGHTVTIGVQYPAFDGTASLIGFDTVYLQANFNWTAGAMPVAGQQQIVDWVTSGGRLVTSEWVAYFGFASGNFGVLGPILPVETIPDFTSRPNETISVAFNNASIIAGLPSSFTFPLDSFSGTETLTNARAGAVSYYNTSDSPAYTALAGCRRGAGYVYSFTSTCGPTQLADQEFGRLFSNVMSAISPPCEASDFNGDGDSGTDQDIEAFFACLAGVCCATCPPTGQDFNGDGDFGTDQDIEAFFRVLAGGSC